MAWCVGVFEQTFIVCMILVSAAFATSMSSTLIISLGLLWIGTRFVAHFDSFEFGRFPIRFILSLAGLNFLRGGKVFSLVIGFISLLFFWRSKIEFVFPPQSLRMLLQVYHDGIIRIVWFKPC